MTVSFENVVAKLLCKVGYYRNRQLHEHKVRCIIQKIRRRFYDRLASGTRLEMVETQSNIVLVVDLSKYLETHYCNIVYLKNYFLSSSRPCMEINARNTMMADLKARTDVLRGYL